MHPVLLSIGSIVIPAYGAVTALGVLLGLFLLQRTARTLALDAGRTWNLCVISLFAALAVSRLLLVVLNFAELRVHPQWLLALAMIHHPLLSAVSAFVAAVAAVLYGYKKRLPPWTTADALAAPLALGLACEQFAALMVGSGYGVESQSGATRWAVTYTDPLAAHWSGTPLGVPLHPVQAYVAGCFLCLSAILMVVLRYCRQPGDAAGIFLLGTGTAVFFTEFWRDPEGRGAILNGVLDGPQVVAILLILAGGLVLRERKQAFAEEEVVHERS